MSANEVTAGVRLRAVAVLAAAAVAGSVLAVGAPAAGAATASAAVPRVHPSGAAKPDCGFCWIGP